MLRNAVVVMVSPEMVDKNRGCTGINARLHLIGADAANERAELLSEPEMLQVPISPTSKPVYHPIHIGPSAGYDRGGLTGTPDGPNGPGSREIGRGTVRSLESS